MKTDKNVKEWSEEYALHRCGIKTLAAWSAQELALANQRTAVLFSLLSEAGLRSDEARAFMRDAEARSVCRPGDEPMKHLIQRAGQEYGPHSIEEIRRYVDQGNIVTSDLAKEEASGKLS
jgi:hypothetical protein